MQLLAILIAAVAAQEGKCYMKNRTVERPAERPAQTPVQRQQPPVQQAQPPAPQSDLSRDCIAQFNDARRRERVFQDLRWDEGLAREAVSSARYCANVAQVHTNVVGSQIIFRSVQTCHGGIQGWFYREKPWNGMHYQIIKDRSHTRVGCASVGSGAGCISCNFQ
jgi:hypothetical protein